MKEVAMTLLDFIEIWVSSLSDLFRSIETTAAFSRTEDARPNHSCSLTLRRGDTEVDFLVWESGHGELAVTVGAEGTTEEHMEDLLDLNRLATTLARIIAVVNNH